MQLRNHNVFILYHIGLHDKTVKDTFNFGWINLDVNSTWCIEKEPLFKNNIILMLLNE